MRSEIIDENLHEFNSQILKLIIHKIFVHAQQKIMPLRLSWKKILISIIFFFFFFALIRLLSLRINFHDIEAEKNVLEAFSWENISFFTQLCIQFIQVETRSSSSKLFLFLCIPSENYQKYYSMNINFFSDFSLLSHMWCAKKKFCNLSLIQYNVNALHRIYHFLVCMLTNYQIRLCAGTTNAKVLDILLNCFV